MTINPLGAVTVIGRLIISSAIVGTRTSLQQIRPGLRTLDIRNLGPFAIVLLWPSI
jgi:hypothetical protein